MRRDIGESPGEHDADPVTFSGDRAGVVLQGVPDGSGTVQAFGKAGTASPAISSMTRTTWQEYPNSLSYQT